MGFLTFISANSAIAVEGSTLYLFGGFNGTDWFDGTLIFTSKRLLAITLIVSFFL